MITYGLMGLYILLEVLIPAASVATLLYQPQDFFSAQTLYTLRIITFFVSIPVFLVYGWIVTTSYFPSSARERAGLFFPWAFGLVQYWWLWPEEPLWNFILFEGLLIYLALYLLFFGGFCALVYQEHKGSINLGIFFAFLILSLLLFAPTLFVFIIGAEVMDILTTPWNMAGYILGIGVGCLSNIPLLKRLYREGQL